MLWGYLTLVFYVYVYVCNFPMFFCSLPFSEQFRDHSCFYFGYFCIAELHCLQPSFKQWSSRIAVFDIMENCDQINTI